MLVRTPQFTGQLPTAVDFPVPGAGSADIEKSCCRGRHEETGFWEAAGRKWKKGGLERDLFLVLPSWTNYINFLRLIFLI